MTVQLTDQTAVLVLWWVTLAVALLVVVPLAVYLLHRLLRTAGTIRRYTEEALAAGGGIASHVRAIPALETTVERLPPVAERAAALEAASERLRAVLVSRGGRGSTGGSGPPGGGAGQGGVR